MKIELHLGDGETVYTSTDGLYGLGSGWRGNFDWLLTGRNKMAYRMARLGFDPAWMIWPAEFEVLS